MVENYDSHFESLGHQGLITLLAQTTLIREGPQRFYCLVGDS
jgi:hypothetical protein